MPAHDAVYTAVAWLPDVLRQWHSSVMESSVSGARSIKQIRSSAALAGQAKASLVATPLLMLAKTPVGTAKSGCVRRLAGVGAGDLAPSSS